MYTELIKIIEAGLTGDPTRVGRYARQLAANLEQAGDKRSARRVLRSLERFPTAGATLDRIASAPVDQDTRLAVADLSIPTAEDVSSIVVPGELEEVLAGFAARVGGRSALEQAGVDIRTSMLLYGPPGSGKTTLATWLAHEVGLPLVVARLDALVSSMLGGTSRNVRRLFDFAGQQPCVLFLDEFDAIAKTRDDTHEMGELKRSVNSLLQNVDAFLDGGGVLLAATNHPDLLDRAVWRRFTTVVEVGYPTPDGVRELLHRVAPAPLAALPAKDWKVLESVLEGSSPSDIRTVTHGAVARAVLDGGREPLLADVLVEHFRLRHSGETDLDALLDFLRSHGASIRSVATALPVSERRVRAHSSPS